MKPLLFALLLALPLAGCSDRPDADDLQLADEAAELDLADGLVEIDGEAYVSFGDPLLIDEDEVVALTPAALTEDLGAYQNTVVRVEGTIAQVCQAKGCWLTLENPTATPIRVLVPRDESGDYFTASAGSGEAASEEAKAGGRGVVIAWFPKAFTPG